MMHEKLLKQYFEEEGAKGDLSPEQWETIFSRAGAVRQGRSSWSPVTWFNTHRPAVDSMDDNQPFTHSESESGPKVRPLWRRLEPTPRLVWIAVGLALLSSLIAASYVINPTLGEKLFSELMGRWDQGYGGKLAQDINMRETIEGITVTVDRAYFDSNRVGVEYTVTGLPHALSMSQLLPEGSRVFNPEAALMDAENPNVRFRSAGGSGVRADSQVEGMEVSPDTVKEVAGFDVTGAQANASGMRLLFVVSVAESVQDGNVFRQERVIGPFAFHIEVPFIPSTEIRIIQVGSTVEAASVRVRLEEVTITPAEVTALIRVDRSPEQRWAGVKPNHVALMVPGEWPSDRPRPSAYVVTTLGDIPDTFLARFHLNWEVNPGEWRLTVEYLAGVDDFDEGLNGPWVFHFQVP